MTGYYDSSYYYEDEGSYERSPLTPDEIENQGFAIAHRGYDRDQVRAFLYEVAAALRLALQDSSSATFGPPPTWSPQPGVNAESTRILRAHLSASLRREAELEHPDAIRERAREEAEAMVLQAQRDAQELRRDAQAVVEQATEQAAAILEGARQEADRTLLRAELDSEELRREIETETEGDRERARRILAAAQEEAHSLVTEAETRARRVLKGARQDALNHAQQVSTTLEARADQLIEAEQSTLQRLNEARRSLSKLIEELAGAEPVVGPTIEILRLAVDARTTGEPSMAGPPAAPTEVEPAEHAEESAHPVGVMVRAAVARAMDAATTDEDDTVAEGEGLDEDEDETLALDLYDLDDDGYDLDLVLPEPSVPTSSGRSGRDRNRDLRDFLSELADIVAEDDEPSAEA